MKSRNLRFSVLVAFIILSMNIYAQKVDNGITTSRYQKSLVNQKTGEINPLDVLQARMQLENMRSGKVLDLNWQQVGPSNVTNFISAVLKDNKDETGNTIYVGGFSGGIWKTTNKGAIWNKVNIEHQNLFVSSFAQDANGNIYVATGKEGYYAGQGIYKSTDGENFTQLPSTMPNVSNDNWFYISKIVINKSGHLFAATSNGLMISTDNGENWVQPKSDGVVIEGACVDIELSEDDAIYTYIGENAYRSNGDINAFVKITGEENNMLSVEAKAIKFATANMDNNIVYAVAINEEGKMINIYRSNDKGANWFVIGPGGGDLFLPFQDGSGLKAAQIEVDKGSDDIIYVGGLYIYKGQKPNDAGYYSWEKALPNLVPTYHPNDLLSIGENNFIVVGPFGMIEYKGNFADFKQYNNIPVSNFNSVSLGCTDKILAGNAYMGTFFFVNEGGANSSFATSLPYPKNFTSAGLTERSVLNPDFIIVSRKPTKENDIGLERSNDMGTAYGQYFLKDKMGLTSSSAEYSSDIIPFKLWETFNDPNAQNHVYFVAEDNNYEVGDTVWAESATAGYPIRHILTENLNAGDSVAVLDKIGSMFFIALEKGSSKKAKLWMTREVHKFGTEPTWYDIAELSKGGVPSVVEVSKDGNCAYVGMEEGVLFRVKGINMAVDSASAMVGGANYALEVDTIFNMENRMVTSVSVDPQDANHVVVALGNYGNTDFIYETTNALDAQPTFNSIQNNLPQAPVHSVLIEKSNSNHIIVGSELGIFTLEGNTWTAEKGDMGNLPIVQLRQQIVFANALRIHVGFDGSGNPIYKYQQGVDNFGTIYAATHGRGIWKSKRFQGFNNPFGPNPTTENQLNLYPNPAQDVVNIKVKDLKEGAIIQVLDLQGRVIISKEINNDNQENIQMELPNLNEGMYVIQVNNNNNISSGKLMITK